MTQQREVILVVDDDPALGQVMAATLEQAGFVTVVAQSGTEALARVQNAAVDLVVSDLQMPGMTGLELISELRASGQEQPVIIVTGADTRDLCTGPQRHGAVACMEKPADPESLIWNIDVALACARRALSRLTTDRMHPVGRSQPHRR